MVSDLSIAIDAMGGDHAPAEIVKGAVNALSNAKLSLLLVGDNEKINAELDQYQYDKSRLTVVHASEIIEMSESPTNAIRRKKDSSLVKALQLVKDGTANGIVSAGNTGALLAGATLIVGRINGCERPALGTFLPNEKGFSFLIDAGANVDAKPSYLLQFAEMGSLYTKHTLKISNPTVGLVNIGAEKEKGNALTKEAYQLLENANLHFTGNVEARDISKGVVDVMVCDAFVGNIILKYSEGFSKSLLSMIKQELLSTPISKIGAILSRSAFQNLKKRFDYQEIGGAPFLGVNGIVVKAHGSSKGKAITSAINQCVTCMDNNIVQTLEEIFTK